MNLPMNMQKNDVGGIRHPASLGIIMSYKLGQELNIPAFFCKSKCRQMNSVTWLV